MSRIKIDYLHPPIPIRSFDYCALREGYDCGDSLGFGVSALDAPVDLLTQESE